MKEGLRRDRAKTHILPISQLGLMEMTRQRHSESVRSAVYDDCLYCKGKGKVKSAETMSVEIQRKLGEILKKRTRDESDFQLRIVVHPTVLQRLRSEDEKHFIEIEIPVGTSYEEVTKDILPGWDLPDSPVARAHGSTWLSEQRSAILIVPSYVAREEFNILINPHHPESAAIRVGREKPVRWDARLFDKPEL
jgi:hypothetical protein